jgi:predicted lipoprotein with Yx(FWY)xxD motif
MRRADARAVIATAAVLTLAGCGASTVSPSTSAAGSAGGPTVKTATVSGHGTVLVAGSNSLTLYQFAKDTAGSGTSACMGSCLSTWPPLTVAAGSKPAAAAGVVGQLGTIVRSDGHGTQVTYNGLPLHFFSGDTKPGDSNGNYPEWSVVAVSSSPGSSTPTATSAGGYPYGG